MGAAPQYDEGPEVAPQNYPEVAHQAVGHGSPHYGYQQPYQTQIPKPEGYMDSTYAATSPYAPAVSPFSQQALPEPSTRRSGKEVICGCSMLVFILSCIVALLSVAVIGLAAGTGVEANRANEATNKLASLNASLAAAGPTKTVTVTASATASPSFNDLDRGCSDNADGTTGTVYSSFSLFGGLKFTIYCNQDSAGTPFMSLFAADFDACMDSCASYSFYEPKFFGNNVNTTCGGVSFIPLWTQKANATTGKAPGNCYLKPAPQNVNNLTIPNIGTECHAAILSG